LRGYHGAATVAYFFTALSSKYTATAKRKMNLVTNQLFLLIQQLLRDEKRFFHQYLPLWKSDLKERNEIEYLFKLYENAEPHHAHNEQAVILWTILLSTLRLYENKKDALKHLFNEKWNLVCLDNLGLIERRINCTELNQKRALEQSSPEYFAAAVMADRFVFLALSGISPKNISPQEAEELYQQELNFLEKAISALL